MSDLEHPDRPDRRATRRDSSGDARFGPPRRAPAHRPRGQRWRCSWRRSRWAPHGRCSTRPRRRTRGRPLRASRWPASASWAGRPRTRSRSPRRRATPSSGDSRSGTRAAARPTRSPNAKIPADAVVEQVARGNRRAARHHRPRGRRPERSSDATRVGMPEPVITTVAVFTRLRLFQELLSSFVGSRQGFAVIAVSSSEIEATRVVLGQRPDVILVDAALPGVWNVADAAVQAGVRMVVFGLADSPHPIESARSHGCRDALLTSATAQDVVDALEDARRSTPHPVERPVAAGDISSLTSRELEVLGLVARGLSNKEIARRADGVRADREDARPQPAAQAGHPPAGRRREAPARRGERGHGGGATGAPSGRRGPHLRAGAGRSPAAHAGAGGLRMRRRLDRISTESPPRRAENAAWAVREYARGARHAVAG